MFSLIHVCDLTNITSFSFLFELNRLPPFLFNKLHVVTWHFEVFEGSPNHAINCPRALPLSRARSVPILQCTPRLTSAFSHQSCFIYLCINFIYFYKSDVSAALRQMQALRAYFVAFEKPTYFWVEQHIYVPRNCLDNTLGFDHSYSQHQRHIRAQGLVDSYREDEEEGEDTCQLGLWGTTRVTFNSCFI